MIVLDTHALIWWIEDRGHLSEQAAAAIEERLPASISPVSFWEVAVEPLSLLTHDERLAVYGDRVLLV